MIFWKYENLFYLTSKKKRILKLLDHYEILTRTFTGWTLTEIKNLSVRERQNWLERAQRFNGRK